MGKKKSKDGEATEAHQPNELLAHLFSADNPFRKSHDQSRPFPPPPRPDVASKLSGPEVSTQGGVEDEPSDERKRKKKTKDSAFEDDSVVTKRKKDMLEVVDDGEEKSIKKSNKKRKRGEIEKEYEEKRLGEGGDETEEDREEGRKEVRVGRKRKAEEMQGRTDMVLRKEDVVYDDETKLLRTVFVGNLPLKTKKKELFKEFASFGEIESARIRSVPIGETKGPRMTAVIKGKVNDAVDRVHAYIVFRDELSAQAALRHNMAKMGGNHIRVDKACPPRKKMKGEAPIYSVKKTVFVGNLPYDVKDEEVYHLFCEDSELGSNLEAVRVVRDPHSGQGKGIAYVLFKTREAANRVVKKELKLRDRTLRLSHARLEALQSKASAPLKRKHPDSGREDHNKRTATLKMDSNHKAKANSLSYQGLRSSKSGVHKKVSKGAERLHSVAKGRTPPKIEKKPRTTKRPAVAARKMKQAETKRKLDSGASEISHRNKKPRRFK